MPGALPALSLLNYVILGSSAVSACGVQCGKAHPDADGAGAEWLQAGHAVPHVSAKVDRVPRILHEAVTLSANLFARLGEQAS